MDILKVIFLSAYSGIRFVYIPVLSRELFGEMGSNGIIFQVQSDSDPQRVGVLSHLVSIRRHPKLNTSHPLVKVYASTSTFIICCS